MGAISWSGSELGQLRMSVGYGGHKRGRPLSPIEVGLAIREAVDGGATLADCAAVLQFKGTGHIGRFLRILTLPKDLRHLVDWGAAKDAIGFTAAVEMTSLKSREDQRVVADAILTKALSSKEVRQVAQLLRRTGRPVESCIDEVLGMRTIVERRYVFVGSVTEECGAKLAKLTQDARNDLLASGMSTLGLDNGTGRLGVRFFTLAGDDAFNRSMKSFGKNRIEKELRRAIC